MTDDKRIEMMYDMLRDTKSAVTRIEDRQNGEMREVREDVIHLADEVNQIKRRNSDSVGSRRFLAPMVVAFFAMLPGWAALVLQVVS